MKRVVPRASSFLERKEMRRSRVTSRRAKRVMTPPILDASAPFIAARAAIQEGEGGEDNQVEGGCFARRFFRRGG